MRVRRLASGCGERDTGYGHTSHTHTIQLTSLVYVLFMPTSADPASWALQA